MQDNVNQHIFDKKFVNASWVDMKEVLDNEIPVAVKPVNKTIVTLSTLLLLSLATIAFLIYLQSSNIPTAELTKEHYIYKNIYINQGNVNWSPNFTENVLSTRVTTFKTKTSKSKSYKSVYNNNSGLIESTLSLNNSLLSESHMSPNTKVVNKLPNIDQAALLINENSAIDFQLDKNKTTDNSNDDTGAFNKIKYNLGLLSFVSSNSNFSGYGFTTGINLPISKKIGIHTGIAVNFVSRNYLMFPFLPRNQESFKSYSPLDQEETYYEGLKSFKQIYLPVNLSYAISDAFSINSGFKFRYTYSQEIDNLLETRASRTISKSETVENAFFNNSNIGLSFGLNYQVSKNLNLILDSEWGMNSLINKNQFKRSSNNNYDLNLINLTTSISF